MNWPDISRLPQLLLFDPQHPLLFHSGFFLVAFLVLMGVALASRRKTSLRLLFLSGFSLYFYYKACGWYVGFILLSAIVDFHLARIMADSESPTKRKALLITSLVLNLGLLATFKYTDFFIENLNSLGAGPFELWHLGLPVGISFYTFENISYTMDVYRKHIRPVQKFLDYLFFLTFFPKLMMGPIVRAADFLPQLHKKWRLSPLDVSVGFQLILSGLTKKLLISDPLWFGFAKAVLDDPLRHTGFECLVAIYAYALVIYCDFSGYSDMALGIGRWLGFRLNPNFDSPYQSKNITEFWRRWHISLSSWLRDYLYISLGGNRKGPIRQYLNLFITMLLGGLWHGASWNFLIWGAWHGMGLMLDKVRMRFFQLPETLLGNVIGIFFTFHFVCVGWLLFVVHDLSKVWLILQRIFGDFQAHIASAFLTKAPLIAGVLLLGYVLHALPSRWIEKFQRWLARVPFWGFALIFVVFVWILIQLQSSEVMLPIYLQF